MVDAGPVRLDGTEGPNNGWLVLIVAALALGWVRSMARGSWIGVLGVLGAGIVIGWTAIENWLDNRQVLDASAATDCSSSWPRAWCWSARPRPTGCAGAAATERQVLALCGAPSAGSRRVRCGLAGLGAERR